MTKYDYKFLELALGKAEQTLNEIGAQGWELVSYHEVTPALARVIFKKSVSDAIILGGDNE